MKFGSWTYNGFKVNFMLQQDTGDTSTFIPNGEWALIGQYHRSGPSTADATDFFTLVFVILSSVCHDIVAFQECQLGSMRRSTNAAQNPT